ncbi:MAG: FAD-binding domain-containing protein [Myxococcota bacterium]
MADTQVVWFKRDLRIADHAPLLRASRAGPVLGLYVLEPSWLSAPTTDSSHVQFVLDSLLELREALEATGARLLVQQGEVTGVLDRLFETHPFAGLWSHEETGDDRSYQRDKAVARWARSREVHWTEVPQFGVLRGSGPKRRQWASQWTARMSKPVYPAPDQLRSPEGAPESETLPSLAGLGLPPSRKTESVSSGRAAGLATLRSFIRERAEGYRSGISSPVSAWTASSRLSPYIAYGNLSLKEIFQSAQLRLHGLRGRRSASVQHTREGLEAFESRLRWHCHFIQKLEDEPALEFRNLNPAFDGLREEDPDRWTVEDQAGFEAWKEGRTGFPMVDAVMRALQAGGWVNFRMRAMLVSFATHQLWLHWREPALFLARHFLDYEPGIHFSQFQMQAGTTGIAANRVYSPAKQVRDQDPTGVFIRRWIPELEAVPDAHLPEPHRMTREAQSKFGCRIGKDYPVPIVAPGRAMAQARAKLEEAKKRAEASGRNHEVLRRHGSRRRLPFASRR